MALSGLRRRLGLNPRLFSTSLSSFGQPESRPAPGHFVNEGGRLVEVLDRTAPRLLGDEFYGALFCEDADVVADVGDIPLSLGA